MIEHGITLVWIPNPYYFMEPYTGMPLPSMWPDSVKNLIFRNQGLDRPYMNWDICPTFVRRTAKGCSCNVYSYSYDSKALLKVAQPFRRLTNATIRRCFPSGFMLVLSKIMQVMSRTT
nr:hypothetical protein [Candidatus Njordarchaeum guaymaensis]